MRYFLLLLVLLIVALTVYYITVIIDTIFVIFGDIPLSKLLIPFYGWIKLFN